MVKDKILVTHARRFQGDVDGKVHNFTKVIYISLNNSLIRDTEVGSYPTEVTVGDYKVFEDFSKLSLPAIFDADFDYEESRKGISKVLKSYTFVKSLDIK